MRSSSFWKGKKKKVQITYELRICKTHGYTRYSVLGNLALCLKCCLEKANKGILDQNQPPKGFSSVP